MAAICAAATNYSKDSSGERVSNGPLTNGDVSSGKVPEDVKPQVADLNIGESLSNETLNSKASYDKTGATNNSVYMNCTSQGDNSSTLLPPPRPPHLKMEPVDKPDTSK